MRVADLPVERWSRRRDGRNREVRQLDLDVVERRDADDIRAHAWGAGRVEPVRTPVADRSDDHDAVLRHQPVRAYRGRVLRPLEIRPEAHVDHVHVIPKSALHGREDDVRGRRSAAAEDAIRAEAHIWSDAGHEAARADDAGDMRSVTLAVFWVRAWMGHERRALSAGVVVVADEIPSGEDTA